MFSAPLSLFPTGWMCATRKVDLHFNHSSQKNKQIYENDSERASGGVINMHAAAQTHIRLEGRPRLQTERVHNFK